MANMNPANNQLPKMEDFIGGPLNETATIGDTDSTTCTVCQEDFDLQSNWTIAPVRMPGCKHLFHRLCIKEWLNSTEANRNLCPTCRNPLCQQNVLSPEQEAIRRADVESRDGITDTWNCEAYASMLTRVDLLFNEQLHRWAPLNKEDYIRIHRILRDQWDRECPGVFICDEHREIGWEWIEMSAAIRVHERVYDANVQLSWSGRQFVALFNGMLDEFNRRYGHNEDSEDGMEDDSESNTADQPIEETPDTVGGEQPHGSSEVADAEQDTEEEAVVAPNDNLASVQDQSRIEGFDRTPELPPEPLQTVVAVASAPQDNVPSPALSPDPLDGLVSDAESDSDTVLENSSDFGNNLPSSVPQSASASTARRHAPRSPTESRIGHARRDAERRQFRESHFREARKRIMEKGIIVSVIPNPGPIKSLSNQTFRVKNLAGEVMCLVQNADDWDRAGGYAIFYRYKD